MATYTVCMNGSKRPSFTTTDLIKARKVAVLKLIEADKKVQWANIYKNGKIIANVAMLIGPNEYVKPSIGLRKGYKFLYDDGSDFQAVYTDGRLGEF